MKYCVAIIFLFIAAMVVADGFLTKVQAQKTFSHITPQHREGKYNDCKVCHTVPTRNWTSPRTDKEFPFPDVRNYPFNEPGTKGNAKHTACVGCHASDFYKPNFCLGCHTVAGPRANARNVRPFPNESNGTQFTTIFPHDVHQDIFASNERRKYIAVGHIALASYSSLPDKGSAEFYNCAVCHVTLNKVPRWAVRTPETTEKAPAAEKDNFKPSADYFKDVPKSHASCFSCHYQRIEPISTDCAGCHKLAPKGYSPSDLIERSSIKFSHEQLGKNVQVGEKVHAKDCMTCHLQTASSSDLQTFRIGKEPDVPFSTCVLCHGGNIKEEFEKRAKNKTFQCNYCHTPALGRYAKPENHIE